MHGQREITQTSMKISWWKAKQLYGQMQKLKNTHVSYMYLYIRNVCNNDVIGLRCTCGSLYELYKKV